MRFRVFVLLLFAGCGPATSAPSAQDEANQSARFTKMIDQRRYADVIRVLEQDPEARGKFRDLLAMAHLGRAGFEPVRFASRVLAPPAASDPALDRLLPGCEAKALGRLDTVPFNCVLKRVWAQLPDPNAPDFARARSLLRVEFADPTRATMPQNTLVALVEAASALARVSRILLRADAHPEPTEEDLVFYAAETLAAADEAARAIERVPYASPQLSELLTGLGNRALFERTGLSVVWVRETGLPLVLEMAKGPAADLPKALARLLASFR